ncbi:LuxR family transcriptional regulator [Actinoplanes lobatus]|uniref:LuxR family transcriptional regulator n=1 Tax=Actinoplanes lobatus TaxID=113568 RepID=A0ABQ4AI09_9ACTN|nr:LuxR family transcriptional regulator [Actinoplanes lobatus]GIE40637.1 LuxR family transcriptional regulator [Actinoplanes lobatus]
MDAFIGTVREGLSATLLVLGEPGIGKTRLLSYAGDCAADLLTARLAGTESEIQLGYAGLHRLLHPFADRAGRLPEPQRVALGIAFGLLAGPPPDMFLVGLATLTLLADVAAETPLICLIDDAQWLDRETLAVLAFVGRRLHADGIGLLFAIRDEPGAAVTLRNFPVLAVAGLDPAGAHRLLESTVPGRMDSAVVGRIVAETQGNPLALVEVASELSDEQLAGAALLPDRLPIGRRLEAHFAGQVQAMPADTQLLLLLAAAAPADCPALLWQAADRLNLAPAALDIAVSEGVLLPGHGCSFRHPLIRSAIQSAAHPTDLRAVHAALAAVTDRVNHPDRRAWHLAEATVGLDDLVAAELESASERARRRGGYAAQAAFLSRAADLTSDPQDRARRLLTSARPYLVIGDASSAAEQLDRAAPGLELPAMRAAAQRTRATIEWFTGAGPAGVPAALLDALATFGPLEERTTRDMLWEALTAGILARQYTVGVTLLDIASSALKAPLQDPSGATIADLLLDAFATRIADGFARAVPLLRAAIAAMRTGRLADEGEPVGVVGCWVAHDLWDDQGLEDIVTRIGTADRGRGALHAVNVALQNAAAWKTWAGRFSEAESCHAEAAEIAATIGLLPEGPEKRIELLAWQGRESETRKAADFIYRVWAGQRGFAVMANNARYSVMILELGLGRYGEALACAAPLFDEDAPGQGNLLLPNLVEAAVRGGDRNLAEAALARLAERAATSGTAWALGLLARSAALLTDDDRADALYRESLDHLARTAVRTESARAHLLYGEWLRRRKRRADARVQLRLAHEMFTGMGAAAFAERTRLELAATGEQPRKRTETTSLDLTPQETRVAALAAGGATNTEISSRLFISSSTVEYHLNKTFRKLGITSRRQLATVMKAGG